MTTPGYAPHQYQSLTDELVAIISIDTNTRMAQGLTRHRDTIKIRCDVPVGGVYVMPATGDQWYVSRLDNAHWKLATRIPFNDNNTLIEPVPGQMIMGGTGPVEMNGSELNVHGPTTIDGDLTVGDTLLRGDSGNLEQSSDGGATWEPVGAGTGGPSTIDDITGLTEALDTKIDKPTTPITPGTGTKITYDQNGLVTGSEDAEIGDITGLTDALANKSDVTHTHDGGGGIVLPLTDKGDLLTRDATDLVRKGVGAADTILKADPTQIDGLMWAVLAQNDIPGLDVSKIISGIFNPAQIPNLGDLLGILSGGQIPGLDASKIISGILGGAQIPSLDASKIGSGQFLSSLIPGLDATKITSGVFGLPQIPGLDASKIISGQFLTGLIPSLDASKIGSGEFLAGLIPGLDATKIISGVLGMGQIPLLDVGKIPGLDTSKIISGIFPSGLIPSLDASKIGSGIFNLPQIPGLDATKIISGTFPQSMIQNLTSNLGSIFTTITSPVSSNLLQNVPVSSIGQFNPELLTNPTYDSSSSVIGGSVWTWDPDVSHTPGGTGSARATANGVILQLMSDPPIPVSPNQVMAISHWLQWSGVVGSGLCFKLGVVAYLGVGLSNNIDLATISNPATNSGWTQLSGSYTVPATGVDNIRLQLTVTSNASAGTVWWDDGSVKKTQLLQQGWTSGLPGDLANLTTGINARALITDLTALMSNLGLGTPSLAAITSRLNNISNTGTFDASKLFNVTNIPQLLSGSVAGIGGAANIGASMQQTWDRVAGASAGAGSLAGITSRLTNLNPSGLFNAAQLSNMPGLPILSPNSVPLLDATKIGSGIFPLGQLPMSQFNVSSITDLGTITDHVMNGLLGTGSQFSGTNPDQARSSLDSIFKDVLNLSQKMQDIRSSQTATDISGTTVTVNFNQFPDGPLPSNFTTTYSGPGTSALGITSGEAGWRTQNNNGNRTAMIVYNVAPTNTDFQIVRGTLASPPPGDNGGSRPRIAAVGRVNDPNNPTTFIWARGYSDGFLSYKGDIGCTVNGVETVFASNIKLTWSMDINFIIGVGGNPRRYQVFSGTTLVYDYTEAGTTSALGAGFRYWGCRTELKTDSGKVVAPPSIVGTSVSDNAPPSVVGSTFRAYRASTGNITFSGTNKVPNNFFDTQAYRSSDFLWDGTNLTIGVEGTYLVNLRYATPNIPGSAKADAALWQNNQVVRRIGGAFADSAFGANSPTGLAGAALIYCKVNDVLCPGYVVTSNTTANGEPTGTASYFEVALVNRSTA